MPGPGVARGTRKAAPRTKPAHQRRRDLLDAGLRVFSDRGVAVATVDDIARAAGIAKGTFYLHFESKENLLAALQEDFESGLVERLDAAAAAADDELTARLAAWVDAAFAHYTEDIALHDVLFHHPVLAHPDPRAQDRRDLVDSLADVIGHGAAGVEVDVEATALLLCSALHRMFDRIWHRDGDIDPQRVRAATHRLFRRAVGIPD